MTRESEFKNSISENRAFLAKRVFDLHLIIINQAEDVYSKMGMIFPVTVSSVVLFLTSAKQASLSDISKALGQPHQLISQRVKVLLKLGLIEGYQDENDKRRTLYQFTTDGKLQSELLETYCVEAEIAFNDLSEELGLDFHQLLNRACESLEKNSFANRFPSYGAQK